MKRSFTLDLIEIFTPSSILCLFWSRLSVIIKLLVNVLPSYGAFYHNLVKVKKS